MAKKEAESQQQTENGTHDNGVNRCGEIVLAGSGGQNVLQMSRPERVLGQVTRALKMVNDLLQTVDVSASDLAPSLDEAMNNIIALQSQLLRAQMDLARIAGVQARNFK